MPKTTAFKKLLTPVLTAAVLAASQGGFAHTSTLLEMASGAAVDNAIAISHGCEAQGKAIIAQSVVFPTVDPIITNSGSGTISDLNDVIEGGTLENIADLISSRDIFLSQKEKTNSLGNVVGFSGTLGYLPTYARGRVPFEAVAPRFADTSCAKKLTVEYATADICSTTKPTISAEKVNLWIPDNGSQFAIKGLAAGVDGVGDPSIFVINRDLVNNPLPTDGSCDAEGPIDVTVTISPQDIDANLPITGWTY